MMHSETSPTEVIRGHESSEQSVTQLGFVPASSVGSRFVNMKFVHPFPARMAPELAMNALKELPRGTRVLDPMMGSGTTVLSARLRGHEGVGIDRDPLAVLIAQAACRDLDERLLAREAARLLKNSRQAYRSISKGDAYPLGADEETRAFIRYWFDDTARRQLAAIAGELTTGDYDVKTFLKIAVSRMIITKEIGVSLAEDVSHSRPHRTRDLSPVLPFDVFLKSADTISKNAHFKGTTGLLQARAIKGDCRKLPFEDGEFDYILTSPPYLNAIDYLRGHKMSLVWLGYQIGDLRDIRSTNIGTDRGSSMETYDNIVGHMVDDAEALTPKLRNTLRLYARDLSKSIGEMRRVIADGGTALFVVGDCTIRGVDVRNSAAVDAIARDNGFDYVSKVRRPLPPSRRYLPPPSKRSSMHALRKRMWDELILKYRAG